MAQPAEATAARPQLLFFFDPRDGRARRVEAFIAQVLQRRGNHRTVAVRRVDVTQHAPLAERLRVAATPALVVVVERKVRARLEQPAGCMAIEGLLSPWLH